MARIGEKSFVVIGNPFIAFCRWIFEQTEQKLLAGEEVIIKISAEEHHLLCSDLTLRYASLIREGIERVALRAKDLNIKLQYSLSNFPRPISEEEAILKIKLRNERCSSCQGRGSVPVPPLGMGPTVYPICNSCKGSGVAPSAK